MHPMIDSNLPNALFAGEIDMVEDAKDDFWFFEDRFGHAIDFQVQEFQKEGQFKIVLSNPEYKAWF